ncbi:putative 2-aminoethylphosphonate ABC transporter substrate-binding protein [Sporosarcina sp. CAU 1771]
MKQVKMSWFFVFVVVLLSVMLASCGGASGKKGKKDTITVYSSMESDELPEYIKRFNAAHPEIEVDLVRDSTGVTTAKLIAEKDNPRADVIFGVAASSIMILEEYDLLAGYNPEGIDRLSKQFKDTINDPALWTGADAYVAAIAVNTAELKRLGLETPQSYKDLLKPEYKNHVIMSNPASSGTGYLTVSSWLQIFGEDEGWKFMDGLHENINQYVHSGSKPAKDVARGEFPIGLTFEYPIVQEIAKGAPVELILPTEGLGWEIEANALVNKKEIKAAAKTFLDWAISDNALEAYHMNHGVIGADVGSSPPEGYPENIEEQMIENDFSWAAKSRDSINEKWIERYGSKDAPKD